VLLGQQRVRSQGRAELAPAADLQWQREPGEPGHKRCLGGARATGTNWAKMAQRSPGKGLHSVLQRTSSNPRGHPWAHPESPESFLPPGAGHQGHLRGAGAAGTWPKWPKGALARGRAQHGRGRQKTPGDQCQSAPGENSFLTPALAIGYSLSM